MHALRLAVTILALAATPAAAAPGACVPAQTIVQTAHLVGTAVELCGGGDAPFGCWRVDLDTGAWTGLPAVQTLPAASDSERRAAGLHLCAPAGQPCTDVTPPGYALAPDEPNNTVAASADLATAATWTGQLVTLVEVAGWKKLAAITGWASPMSPDRKTPATIQLVRFVGPAVELLSSESPVSDSARLYSARNGKLIGWVGKAHTEVDDTAPVQLAGDRWVFTTFQGQSLLIVNVKSGKLERTISLTKTPVGGVTMLALAPDGKHLVVAPSSSDAPIYVLDPAGGKPRSIPFPVCPKP